MPSFLVLWAGQALSLLGSMAVQFSLIWWLTQKTGSTAVLATAALLGLLPTVALGPLIGVLVDRWDGGRRPGRAGLSGAGVPLPHRRRDHRCRVRDPVCPRSRRRLPRPRDARLDLADGARPAPHAHPGAQPDAPGRFEHRRRAPRSAPLRPPPDDRRDAGRRGDGTLRDRAADLHPRAASGTRSRTGHQRRALDLDGDARWRPLSRRPARAHDPRPHGRPHQPLPRAGLLAASLPGLARARRRRPSARLDRVRPRNRHHRRRHPSGSGAEPNAASSRCSPP